MSETQPGHDFEPEDGGAPARAPHRVIGTPPPARARTLLGEAAGTAPAEAPRELPAEPANLRKAKTAERVVASLFILSMLASIGFIAAYVGLEVHSVTATLRSNLALGLSMGVAFMAMGAGATIWVRNIMPDVEQVEERHPLAATEQEREAFAKTFTEGAEASGFVKRPLLRHTVWRNGTRMVIYGPNTPLRAADFSTFGQMITVVPEGYAENQDVLAKAVVIIIKFAPDQLVPNRPGHPGTIMNWTVDNIGAYSKICTHVGCPVALYEQTTHHILCPC